MSLTGWYSLKWGWLEGNPTLPLCSVLQSFTAVLWLLLHRGLDNEPFPLVPLALCVPRTHGELLLLEQQGSSRYIYDLTVHSITFITIVIPDVMAVTVPQKYKWGQLLTKTDSATREGSTGQLYELNIHRTRGKKARTSTQKVLEQHIFPQISPHFHVFVLYRPSSEEMNPARNLSQKRLD